MKKLLLVIFCVITQVCFGQVAITVYHPAYSNPGTSNVDTTHESIWPSKIVDVAYDITRPNKVITLGSDTYFSIDNVILGQSGNVRFILTSSIILTLNGKVITTVPSSAGTYNLSYTNIGGLITWSTPIVMPTTCNAALIQPNGFTFNLLTDALVTSAGVYNGNVLIKTLWSNVPYKSGNHNFYWNGLDDDGNAQPIATYTIKVASNNNISTWIGTVGNNSDNATGINAWRGGTQLVCMDQTGNNLFVGMEFSEVAQSQMYFNKSTPSTMVTYKNFATTYAGSVAVCSNGTYRFWGLKDYQGTHNFVNIELVSNNSVITLANTVPFTGAPPQSNYAGVLDLNSAANTGIITGIAVQSTASSSQYLYVSHANMNQVDVFNIVGGGSLVRSFTLTGASALKFEGDGFLWVASGTTETKYIVNADGTLSPTGISISGFQNIAATDIFNGNLLVFDGGTNQVIKEYNTTSLSLLMTVGTVGGYSSSPTVTNTKFYIHDLRGNYSTFVHFVNDGTFWLGDSGNGRAMHFDGSGNYIENITYFPEYTWFSDGTIRNGITYNVNLMQNEPTALFSDFLEYYFPYSGNTWTLKYNWGYNLPSGWHNTNTVVAIDSMSNGRRYAILSHGGGATEQMAELTTTGLRIIPGLLPQFATFKGDGLGNLVYWTRTAPTGNATLTYQQSVLTGFTANNPTYAGTTNIGTINIGYQGPVPVQRTFQTTTSGKIVIFQSDNLGNRSAGVMNYHLGAYDVGTFAKDWLVSPVTFTQYTGPYPNDGTYDIGNSVNANAGGSVAVVGNEIAYGYHGEFWRKTQTGLTLLFNDIGLLKGIYGLVVPQVSNINGSQAAAAYPDLYTNCLQMNMVNVAGNDWEFNNDESIHCGVHVAEITHVNDSLQTESVTLVNTPYTITSTKYDLNAGVPRFSTVQGVTNWSQNPPTNSAALFSNTQRDLYNFSLSPDIIVNGNGQLNATYYIKRLIPFSNLSVWQWSGLLDLELNSFTSSTAAFNKFYIAILDVNGKVIMRFEPFTDNTIGYNGVNLGPFNNPKYPLSPFVFARSGSQVYCLINIFGQWLSSVQNIYDGTADISNPAYIEVNYTLVASRTSNGQYGLVQSFFEGK